MAPRKERNIAKTDSQKVVKPACIQWTLVNFKIEITTREINPNNHSHQREK
jgi:hypothetical protein